MSLQVSRDIREEKDPGEYEPGAGPVEGSEGVGEVPNGEEEAEELPGGQDQAGRQAGALRRQDEHGEDAEVLEDHVGGQMEDHDGDLDLEKGDVDLSAGHTDPPVLDNVRSQEGEQW